MLAQRGCARHFCSGCYMCFCFTYLSWEVCADLITGCPSFLRRSARKKNARAEVGQRLFLVQFLAAQLTSRNKTASPRALIVDLALPVEKRTAEARLKRNLNTLLVALTVILAFRRTNLKRSRVALRLPPPAGPRRAGCSTAGEDSVRWRLSKTRLPRLSRPRR